MGKQELCDSFYDISNLITIRITMARSHWAELRNAEPHGGRCNHAYTERRYDWYRTTYVDISGTRFPEGDTHRFNTVGISKKSYCGSFSTTKPGLKLDFSMYLASNEDAVEDLIGTQFITLNNSIDDPSFIRQTLGYKLFEQAELPYSRCNYACVYVNGDYIGLYINVEPIQKRYIQHNFDDNDEGNLYEIEAGEDFNQPTIDADRISFEGFSEYSDKKDLELAVREITRHGWLRAPRVINSNQFIRFFAMEFLLKHWDGYTDNLNNTYIYNDVRAVAYPTTRDVDFKFIPWGLDQILKPDRNFQVDDDSVLGRLVRENSDALTQLKREIRDYATTIFDRHNIESVLLPLINRMARTISLAGVTDAFSHIEEVKQQLKLVKSGAFQFLVEFPEDSFFLVKKDTNDCMYCTDINRVGSRFPVYHRRRTASRSDRWTAAYFSYARTGINKFINLRHNKYLHGDTRYATYNVDAVDFRVNEGTNWEIVAVDCSPGDWEVTGYFRLKNERTTMYIYYSEEAVNPGGYKLVYQRPTESRGTIFYLF